MSLNTHAPSDLDSLCELSAQQMIAKIREGEVSISEINLAHANKIHAVEKNVKAWIFYDRDSFLQRAQETEKRYQQTGKIGALYGLPVGIKDIFNTTDMPTCMGSPIWKDFWPGNNARVVDHIVDEGGVLAGKTVTAEFAVHAPGPTLNPRGKERIPGTSSSGSAAAVATGMVPLALGTQTAGSTIRPASYCGIYGFRPSFGTVPRTGILKTLDTLDHVSALGRCADDVQLLFDVMRVRGKNHPYIYETLDSYESKKESQSKKLKIAFIRTEAWGHAKAYAQEAITQFARTLDQMEGVQVEEFDSLPFLKNVHEKHGLIYEKALSYYFKDEYEQHQELISDVFCQMVLRGRKISVPKYKEALDEQVQIIHHINEFLSDFDLILSLSTSGEAPLLSNSFEPPDPTLIWTYCHVPAVSLPVFQGPAGMPFGAQLVGKRYHDYQLLDFVRRLEKEGIIPPVKIATALS